MSVKYLFVKGGKTASLAQPTVRRDLTAGEEQISIDP